METKEKYQGDPIDKDKLREEAKEARRLELNERNRQLRLKDNLYGPKSYRNRYKRVLERLQETFTKVTQDYVNSVIETGLDFESDDAINIFDKYNLKWKSFARKIITSNTKIFDNKSTRESVINRFEGFVEGLLERREKEKAKEETPKEVVKLTLIEVSGKNYTLDIIKEAFSEAGIKTQAKTQKGIDKVLTKYIGDPKLEIFTKYLKSV